MPPVKHLRESALYLMTLCLVSCQVGESGQNRQQPALGEVREESGRPRIVALGDSLTAGFGISADEAYPAALQDRLDEAGYGFEVVNAGVSGDTTAGGLRRLDWALDGDVRILILALGGNDGLRGLPVDEMKSNLAQMIERAQVRNIAVLLAGIVAPKNLGSDYTSQFEATFSDLAREYDVVFFPFLLKDVAGELGLNQNDGIHPNAKGARIMAENVWIYLQPMLESVAAR